ncbi:MAG: bifunctional riboflavin kinase/FAD synthetase [Flavobacteriales bacterium]|nr:bifunctional riboflavin kinase/FAD synthetase [Flavobacteriales bacterium]
MKIYKSIEAFDFTGKTAVTIGTFDGVHSGHKVIIDRLKKAAADSHAESVILTFFPHPRMVLYPDDNELRLLNTIDERIELLEKAGIDHLIIHPFSREFSRLSSTEFVRDILVNQLHVAALVIGYDHHFGRNREGSFEHLRELAPLYDFKVQEIAAQEIQKVNVSSTKIRTSLAAGEINAANQFLGYHFFMNGRVVEGNKTGRTIGFPTANLKVDEWYKLIPAKGVYAVKVHLDGNILKGMLNIGNRPTLNGEHETIEVNLFDFNEDIYNKTLTVEFYERIRDEFRFESLDELKKQLNLDKEKSIQILD